MRPEFIQLAKSYLTKKNHSELIGVDIKNILYSLGVSEKEYQEALKQIKHTQIKENLPKSPANSLIKSPSKFKKLVELDIVAHLVLAIFVLALAGAYTSSTFLNKDFLPFTGSTQHYLASSEKKSLADSLMVKAYANASPIDANQILTFPTKPVSLKIAALPKREIYGFFPYWMLEKQAQIDLSHITTLALFGMDIDKDGNILATEQQTVDNHPISMWTDKNFTALITRAQKAKIALELTIKSFNAETIDQVTTSNDAQKTFIANAVYMMNSKGLSGINLDFEYTGTPSKAVTDGFTRLITNLRTQMQKELPKSTLTLDVHITSASLQGLFAIENLAPQIDSFIVMGYDIHTPSGSAGPIAPIDGPLSITGFMQSFLEKIVPNKLILAVPYYAYDWTVGVDGQGTILPYAQALEASKTQSVNWDEKAQSPSYIYTSPTNEKHVVYFENIRSLAAKFDYINKKDLKGVGIWALGYDGDNPDIEQLYVDKFSN